MSVDVVKLLVPEPQYTSPSRTRDVVLVLDHLEDQTQDGVGLKELFADEVRNSIPGEKVAFSIRNAVSPQERELVKFCKEQMKKKKVEDILAKATELLKTHPSSMWAHFFYGVACKKIPSKEKLFVPALTAAVTVNPNFLSGWQALHKHFLSLGGLFSEQSHDEMCLILKVLLKLDPDFDSWCKTVGHIWDYVMSNNFNQNRVLSIVAPYLNCSCPQRRTVAASVFVNFIREKKKFLPLEFSDQVLTSFQILISDKDSEIYRLGILYAALRYFNRTNDLQQVCRFLRFIHVNDVLRWNLNTAKEFAYNLIYELFKSLGEEALEAIVILRNACGLDMLTNKRYFLCNTVFKLTNSYGSLLNHANTKLGNLKKWGRLLYLKVLVQLKLYQEAYEEILNDLNCDMGDAVMDKAYMAMLVEIFSRAMDERLQMFTVQLGYEYLRIHGLDTRVLHCLCLSCVSLKDFDTAREILQRLMSSGALDDVIYLQALLEEDQDLKLDYLKSLENIPDASLLSATVYRDLEKPRRVVKSILEASYHFHGGIVPFEWLGVYYYERDLFVKSIKYFLEAFSNYLVSRLSVNYIISIYSKHGVTKTRAFFETLGTRNAISMDVACTANLKAGLNFMTKAKETLDFHRALERFRKVTDFAFERKIIEMVADSLGYFGMHGSAADFYLMCHAENDVLHVYPSVMYGAETKMIKGKGHRYLSIARNVAQKAGKSPLAFFTYGCALFDRAVSSYLVNNYRHSVFLCQQAVLVLSRCIALYSNVATFWISMGNVLLFVSGLHSDLAAVYVPSWLLAKKGQSQTMVLVKKHESFVLALRCYSTAREMCKSDEIRKLVDFHLGLSFRYAKTFYKEIGDRMLCWALSYALDSCDSQCWQRNNLCGVILTGLGEYRQALDFFKDAMLIGAKEDARDAEFNLGIVYLRLGEFTNAHEVFMHRRGNDPNDSLVWRSYMLLHRCLGDDATVLHYLWYLIYSIRHYPSLDQGIEYLQLMCKSSSITNADVELKKKCLLYAIFQTPMFLKMSFVGDCEVPHKFNGATGYNYFYYGKLHAAQGHLSAAAENFYEFLKLVAENRAHHLHDDESYPTLSTSSARLHHIAVAKLISEQALRKKSNPQRLMTVLNQQESDYDRICTLDTLSNFSQLPSEKISHLNVLSKASVCQIAGIPPPDGRFHPSPCSEDTMRELIDDIFGSCVPGETSSTFLDKWSILYLLKEQLVKNNLLTGQTSYTWD